MLHLRANEMSFSMQLEKLRVPAGCTDCANIACTFAAVSKSFWMSSRWNAVSVSSFSILRPSKIPWLLTYASPEKACMFHCDSTGVFPRPEGDKLLHALAAKHLQHRIVHGKHVGGIHAVENGTDKCVNIATPN